MTDEVIVSERDKLLQRVAKLKISLDEDIPYKWESVFTQTDGWGGNGEIKRRAKLLKHVGPKLQEMLLSNEEVLYVAKGVQYSFAENYFMGAWLASMINQTAFVLTNLRLLMLRCNGSGKPHETYWVIYYSEIDQFKPNWAGVLKLKLQDRKTLTFTGFNTRDRKAMPSLFQSAIEQYQRLGFSPDVSQSRENLCSYCYQVVPKGEYHCDSCGADYWSPKQLALRSLIFPSWGDLCMKHYGMATVELIGYAISWFAAINALQGPDKVEGLVIALAIFLIEHPFDAVLTYHVASKGLNPRRGPGHDHVHADDDVDDLEEVT